MLCSLKKDFFIIDLVNSISKRVFFFFFLIIPGKCVIHDIVQHLPCPEDHRKQNITSCPQDAVKMGPMTTASSDLGEASREIIFQDKYLRLREMNYWEILSSKYLKRPTSVSGSWEFSWMMWTLPAVHQARREKVEPWKVKAGGEGDRAWNPWASQRGRDWRSLWVVGEKQMNPVGWELGQAASGKGTCLEWPRCDSGILQIQYPIVRFSVLLFLLLYPRFC